jgi:hypothetical protein
LEPVLKGDSAGAQNDPSTVNLVAQLRV